MNHKPSVLFEQSGVIPYRRREDLVDALLITSSDGRRWGIPIGMVEPNMTPAESAAKEAFEEAGIKGRVHLESVGAYSYEKWGGTCRVEVFLMEVEEESDVWPEMELRKRQWVSTAEAVERVQEPGLKKMLATVA